MDLLWRLAWDERERLLALARRRSRNRADAEEIVAEAVVRAVTMPGARADNLPGLLTAIVMRLCVDRLRERVVAERHAPRLFARTPDVTEEVLDQAEAEWLVATMAHLADKERAALTARMLGLTVAETAEVLGITYKSAESALDRAKRKMRTLWTRTLALIPLRRRKVVVLGVAVAVTATLATTQPWRREPETVRPPVVEQAQQVRTSGVDGEVEDRSSPLVRSRAPLHTRPSSAAPVRVATPDLRVGPVRAHPWVVKIDLSDPVSHVRECLREGVKIETQARIGVVCREGSGD